MVWLDTSSFAFFLPEALTCCFQPSRQGSAFRTMTTGPDVCETQSTEYTQEFRDDVVAMLDVVYDDSHHILRAESLPGLE